ncbi:MAG: hypothetical protein JRH20_29600 [Deltaproteobacteria bacterium]|nr:hypothetical protein [Deltaproteobacteria bacterium]
MDKREVLGIGGAHVEQLALVDRYPEPGSRAEMAGYTMQWGGPIVTALSTLANLGSSCRLLGKLGDDVFGRFVLRGCAEFDIDIESFVTQKGRVSPCRIVVAEHATRRRSSLTSAGNVDPLGLDEVDLSALDGAKLLLVDGLHGDVQLAAAERARAAGTRVVLDAREIREGMGELMAISDVLIATERFASEVAPRGEIEDSLIELCRMGPEMVVVKQGKEGSIGLQGEMLVRQPPLKVEVVDTTGAGDVFVGGYCYGLCAGASLERCIQLASAAAGLSCKEFGPLGGLPSRDELERIA